MRNPRQQSHVEEAAVASLDQRPARSDGPNRLDGVSPHADEVDARQDIPG